jgi:hypothetical protein
MSFFDDVPEPEDHWEVEPRRPPEWSGPPENVVGGTAVLDLVLANDGDTAIVLTGVTAFPTGVALRVSLRRRYREGLGRGNTLARLRFGVELADGRRTTADRWDEDGDGPRLTQRGGGGGGLVQDWEYWLWPLPPEGMLRIACAWPDEGVEETVVEIDAAPIREAAGRAVELWPDERPELASPVWTST